jgi:hypothetical protein
LSGKEREMFKNKTEQRLHWEQYAEERLVGRTIKSVRWISESEASAMGWYSRPIVILLDDGSQIFPSQDDEGNNGGALFGQGSDGDDWTFPVNGG